MMRPFHPLADIFPLIEGDELDQLVSSIRESHGPREPIILYEDKILDGRNRARACEALGIEPSYRLLRQCDGDPLTFVVDKNLHRRHLDDRQRASVAAKIANLGHGGDRSKLPIGNLSVEKSATIMNVAPRQVRRAQVVHRLGIPEVRNALDRGEIAVSAAEEIAQLPANVQPEAITKVLPKGARAIMGSRKQPKDDLDYLPTPPWATRALMECVFPALNVSRANFTTVHEPACGEGHMAEVLSEYFRSVSASDIHGYGYGEVRDFLAPDCHVDADWIITNPPFKDKAEQFTLKALEQARVGVVIFTQLRWLETIRRYERLFRDHPPTQIALFCERVPLHVGCWKPDGSTATAYIWLVWIKGFAPRAPFWIPPDQRKLRSRPDDIDRFTASPVIKKAHRIEHLTFSSSSADSVLPPSGDDGLDIPSSLRIGHPENNWLRRSEQHPPSGGRE
jgi:hypothetical protein